MCTGILGGALLHISQFRSVAHGYNMLLIEEQRTIAYAVAFLDLAIRAYLTTE